MVQWELAPSLQPFGLDPTIPQDGGLRQGELAEVSQQGIWLPKTPCWGLSKIGQSWSAFGLVVLYVSLGFHLGRLEGQEQAMPRSLYREGAYNRLVISSKVGCRQGYETEPPSPFFQWR